MLTGGAVFDPCMSEPCENNGTCIGAADKNFTCSCLDGTNGTLCENSQSIFC